MSKVKLYPGEKTLEDNDTIFCGEWYLLNGKPYRSEHGGNVTYLKTVLGEDAKCSPENIEVKYCNKFARRLS